MNMLVQRLGYSGARVYCVSGVCVCGHMCCLRYHTVCGKSNQIDLSSISPRSLLSSPRSPLLDLSLPSPPSLSPGTGGAAETAGVGVDAPVDVVGASGVWGGGNAANVLVAAAATPTTAGAAPSTEAPTQ